MDKVANAQRELGARLRQARVAAGFTLAHLAAQTGLSVSFLSRIERGQASSSIANLLEICEALDLGMHDLFPREGERQRTSVRVYRALEEMEPTSESSGYSWAVVGGGREKDSLDIYVLTFPVRDEMQSFVSHEGQEYCHVLSGTVRFYVSDECHLLQEGDGIFIESRIPHRAESAGDEPAQVLMAVSKAPGPAPLDWWQLRPAEQEPVE